ncbi:putative periplasmic binding protein-like I [Dioscorea sansibarensis]
MNQTFQFVFFITIFLSKLFGNSEAETTPFPVGVVLDTATLVGKMGKTSISMAVDEFYETHRNYSTRLVIYTRDSKNDVVDAANEVIDLLNKKQVKAIIGPQKSSQVVFISNLGNKAKVPIISFSATSPALSSITTPYFLRSTLNDSAQLAAVSSITKLFGWRQVVPVYEDTDYGRDIVPYLVDALEKIDAKIPYRSVIALSATDDQIKEELYKLMTMQTRVFLVHMSAPMAARLLMNAKQMGMMSKGYAWIMTDGITNIVDSFDPQVTESMQGALGVKLHVPRTKELNEFSFRWKRRYQKEYPNEEPAELSVFGLWAYDTVFALAMAVEKANGSSNAEVLKHIQEEKFNGVSGEFHFVDGQLKLSTLQVVNIVGRGGRGVGFWKPENGLTSGSSSSNNGGLNPVIWPGESTEVPKGWEIPVSGKKLRVGVPVKDGFFEFLKVERNPVSNASTVTGFCIDVFDTVMRSLPYAVSYEYIPFEDSKGDSAGSYNELVYQVYLQKFDAVAGDIAIISNRSQFVDFTLPYTESGVVMIVPIKEDERMNAWIFLKPLTLDLWLGSLAFFFLTALVVWLIEHRDNDKFKGSPCEQVGIVLYFTFSTLVFAHREKVDSNFTRFLMIIWLFVVLILTQSYTASLTSMLTVQQLQPTVTEVEQLIRNGDSVGYHKGSFVKETLINELHFDKSKLVALKGPDDYVEALTKGSSNNGVSAVFHEIPYMKLFLAKHCKSFMMVGPTYKTAGFGFVFPKGSPLVPDVSRAILNISQGTKMAGIEKKWIGYENKRQEQDSPLNSQRLNFRSFAGLFLITGLTSIIASLIYSVWPVLIDLDIVKAMTSKYFKKRDIISEGTPVDDGSASPVSTEASSSAIQSPVSEHHT